MKSDKQLCAHIEPLIGESMAGTIGEADRERLRTHLSSCEACTLLAASYAQTIELAKSATPRDPGPEFWGDYYERLQERMDPTPSPLVSREVPLSLQARLGLVLLRLGLHPQPVRRFALAVILIGIGIFLGRATLRNQPSEPIAQTEQPEVSAIRLAATEARAYDYLGRSKTLLIGLVNFDGGAADADLLNLPRRREIASELLVEASDLRTDLSETDQHRLEELVQDLEVILMQIANLEASNDVPEIEILQSGVDQTGILFRINVEEMRRSEAPVRPKDRPSKSLSL